MSTERFMKQVFPALVAFILASPAAAQSASNADLRRAVGEVAGELEICSVYFLIVSSCVSTQKPETARTYEGLAAHVSELAIASGRSVGISDEAYAAQASLYTEAMMKAMRKNLTNIAVLLQRYAKFCQRLSQDADPPA